MFLSYILLAAALSEDEELDRVELAKKIKNGDQKAFKKFFDRHYQPLLHFLLSKRVSKMVAEDLIQNAFLYIWNHRQNIDPEKSLRAYLFRIGYTRLLNHYRDHAKFDNSEPVPESSSELTPEDHLRGEELQKAVEKAIQAMPEKRRTVFELCFIQDFTYREAAETLNITRKTVENHMGLAFKDIRASLKHFKS